MRNKFPLTFIFLSVAFGFACKQNPVDRLTNPIPQGALNQSSGVFVVYDDEIKTGGGLGLIPYGNNQFIDVKDNSTPARSLNDIFYSWNGQDVPNNGVNQHLFAGFLLPVASRIEDLPTSQPKNLSAAGYHTLKFFIRGTLSDRTKVRVEGPDDGIQGIHNSINSRRQGDSTGGDIDATGKEFVVTNDWQEYSLTVPAGDFVTVKSFLTVTFQFSQPVGTTLPGGGGVIYFDDIRYVK